MREDKQETSRERAKRIRAARDWLGEAESSLESGRDAAGDLKVMLAEAELTRAREKTRLTPWQRFGRRILPLTLFALFVVLGFFLHPAAEQAGEGTPVSIQQTAAENVSEVSAAPEEQAAEAMAAPEPYSVPAVAPVSPPQESNPAREPAPAAAAPVPASPPAAPVPPSQSKQKLMQAAGKVLREP